MNSAIVLIAGFLVLRLMSSFVQNKIQSVYIHYLGNIGTTDNLFTLAGINKLNQNLIFTLVIILMPVLGLIMVSGLVVNYWQVGFCLPRDPWCQI